MGPVQGLEIVARGYTHNLRAIATLEDGRSVFVKQAVDDTTALWLRQEHELYAALGPRTWLPSVTGFLDGETPLLVLEDLTDATWPPPWDTAQIDAVLGTLAEVADAPRPAGLPCLADGEAPDDGWGHVLAHPDRFLSLGLCRAAWLDGAGPVLAAAATAAPLAGNSLLHCDVRSDNLCFRPGRSGSVLFDWNLASVGNPQFDVAFWLPSLAAEGGARPEDVMPECPAALAAYVSGFFASRAGEPTIAHAPLVRQVQRHQLRTALPWATRLLGLAPPH